MAIPRKVEDIPPETQVLHKNASVSDIWSDKKQSEPAYLLSSGVTEIYYGIEKAAAAYRCHFPQLLDGDDDDDRVVSVVRVNSSTGFSDRRGDRSTIFFFRALFVSVAF